MKFIMIIFGIVMIVIGCGFTYSCLIKAAFNAATITTFIVDAISGLSILFTGGILFIKVLKNLLKRTNKKGYPPIKSKQPF